MRRLTLLFTLAALAATAPSANAQEAAGCEAFFPEAEFESRADAGPVVVRGSGLAPEMTRRYAGDFDEVVDRVAAEIGGLAGVEVCIFADDIPLDAEALGWYPGHPLRAVAFGEEGIVVISAWLPGLVPAAGNVGLIHVGLWQESGGSYPQPFADDVMGWYLGQLAGTTGAMHNAFLRQQIGMREPWPPFPWATSRIEDPILWNPEFGYGGAGDFTDYVVRSEGAAFLADPDPDRLVVLDEGWRNALFDESGAVRGGSKGWIIGVIAAALLLVAAVGFAWLGRVSRRRAEEALRELAIRQAKPVESAPGLAEAVRPSVGGGPGGGDSRVGSAAPRAVRRRRDDRNRPPAGGEARPPGHGVAKAGKPGDDIFRHPSLRDED
jgi:hypothetical protein